MKYSKNFYGVWYSDNEDDIFIKKEQSEFKNIDDNDLNCFEKFKYFFKLLFDCCSRV